MKLALFSRLPYDLSQPRGGIETVTVALVQAFSAMDDLNTHVITLERGRRHLEVAEQAGVTVHRLPRTGCPEMLDIIVGPGRKSLRSYLAKLQPDIVHCHETFGLGIGPLPMASVFTVHGFDHANIPAENGSMAWLRAPLWKRIERWGLARQKHIISITQYVRNLVEPLTNAHIYDIDNPIDPACFQIPRNEIRGRVFFAGWITRRKNPLGLIHAFAKARDKGVDATLHLAGEESDPPYAASVRKGIEEYGLGDHVHLLGRVRTEDIRRELGAASVFVLPSRQENAPMAISESMAAGVPVIASNLCGMPFMVREGETGYLIDPDDHDMIAERIIRLLTDGDLRKRMGRQAAEDAKNRFHPTSVASKTRAVYESVMAEFAGSACGCRGSAEYSATTVTSLGPQPNVDTSSAQ